MRTRRRTLARSFTHTGVKATFDKIRGQSVDKSIEDFVRGANAPAGSVATPDFARNFARVFLDAHSKREDADYDRNEYLSAIDAGVLLTRVEKVVRDWVAAATAADRDFKHALYILMLLKGQLRRDGS